MRVAEFPTRAEAVAAKADDEVIVKVQAHGEVVYGVIPVFAAEMWSLAVSEAEKRVKPC